MNHAFLELKTNGLRLYYKILKLHAKKLPKQLRSVSDLFIKNEFRLNHNSSDQQKYRQFYDAWKDYHFTLYFAKNSSNTSSDSAAINRKGQNKMKKQLKRAQDW